MARSALARPGMPLGSIAESLFLVALIFLLCALAGCASPQAAYVTADASTFDAFADRIDASIARDRAEGRIDQEEAQLLEGKLWISWPARIANAGGTVTARRRAEPVGAPPPPPITPAAPAPRRAPDAARPPFPSEEREPL